MDDLDKLAEAAERRHRERIAARRAEAKAAIEELELGAPEKQGPRTRGYLTDISAGIARGPIAAIRAAWGGWATLVETVQTGLGLGDIALDTSSGMPSLRLMSAEETRAAAQARQKGTAPDLVERALDKPLDLAGAPQTAPGKVAEGISQFVSAFVPISRLAAAGRLLQGTAPADIAYRGTVLGAATSAIAFDGQEANLANLIQLAPSLQNPVTEFLATSEDDSEAVGRLKNAVTDALGGVAVEGAIALARAVKSARRASQEVLDDPSLGLKADDSAPVVDTEEAPFTPEQLDIGPVRPEPVPAAPVRPGDTVQFEPVPGVADVRPKPKEPPPPLEQPAQGSPELAPEGAPRAPEGPPPVAYDDPKAAEALDARADKLTLVDDAPKPAAEAEPLSALKERAEKLKEAADKLTKTAEAEKARRQPIKDLSDDEAVRKVSTELGITEDQINELARKVAAGEVKPEQVMDLLRINPQRLDWSSVKDAEDMVGLLNTVTRIFEAAGLKAGSAKVTIKQIVTDARAMGASFDNAVELWQRVRNLPAQVHAARVVRSGSAARLKALADAAKGGSDADALVAFVRHSRVHAALDAIVKGSQSEIGRALRVMREGVAFDEAAFKMANARRLRAARKAAETAAEQEAKIARAKALRAEAAAARKAAKLAAKEAEKAEAAAKAADETEERLAARAREFLTEAADKRRAAEAKKAKAAQRQAAKEAARKAREAEKAAKEAEKRAKDFEDFNNRDADKSAKADVDLDREMQTQMDEVDRALAELGYTREQARSLAGLISKSENAMEASLAARQGMFHKVSDWIATLYINSILSGMRTMALNVMSGIYKVFESTVERYGAALLGGDKYDLIAANKASIALTQSFFNAWRMAGKAFVEGSPQTDVLAKAEVAVRNEVAGSSAVGKVVTLPSRTIITIDEFFKTLFYHQELTARAVEVAAAAARFQPTKGAQKRMFEQTLKKTLDNPPDDLILDAIDNARYQTFQKDLESGWLKQIQSFGNKHPLFKLVVPFVKTPSNIIKQAVLERSPVALFSRGFYKTLAEGGRAGRTAAFRVMLGTSFVGMAAHLAMQGDIVGSDAGVKSNRNTADLAGVKPYSIRLGGQWYQFSKVDPIGTVLGLAADLVLIGRNLYEDNTDELVTNDADPGEIGAALLGIVTENLTDKSFFKGLSDFAAAISGDENAVATFTGSVVTGLVPFSSLSRSAAQQFDEFGRQAFALTEKIMAQTPGLSDKLPPRRDVLGRPVKHPERLGFDLVSPIVVSKEDPDPVARAVAELGVSYRMPRRDIAGVKLNSEQYSRLVEVRGKFIYDNIKTLMETGRWYSAPRGLRAAVFSQLGEVGTSIAQDTLAKEYPQLGSVINQYRYEQRAIRSGALTP